MFAAHQPKVFAPVAMLRLGVLALRIFALGEEVGRLFLVRHQFVDALDGLLHARG